MITGGEFRCYNCRKLMIKKVNGTIYDLELQCPRCKSDTEVIVRIKCKEPIPFVAEEILQNRGNESESVSL